MVRLAVLAVFLCAASCSRGILPAADAAGPLRSYELALQTQAPGSITCPAGLACVAASGVSGKPYFVDITGVGWPAEETQAFWRRPSAPSSPSNGSAYYDTTLTKFQLYSGGWFEPANKAAVDAAFAALEVPFLRACTLTSAAAGTPVTCLLDADVPTGKRAYLGSWRAYVDGATAWSGVTNCTLRDTASIGFITIPVAALTGNALINDATAGLSLGTPYLKSTGTSLAKGLEVVCNTAGMAGSNLVVTVGGTIR